MNPRVVLSIYLTIALLVITGSANALDFYTTMKPGDVKEVTLEVVAEDATTEGKLIAYKPLRGVKRATYETYYFSPENFKAHIQKGSPGKEGKEGADGQKVKALITLLHPTAPSPAAPGLAMPEGGFQEMRYMVFILE